ncbi:MAG: hypothetical protein P4L42_09705 [Desulfocapsaceae bacterium]|nr:hypothetical protein [Desulfocapsaceae bacterium]
MNSSTGDLAAMVFKPVLIQGDFGSLSLDGPMLRVLMSLDGELTLGQVARKIGMSLADIGQVTTRLAGLNLVRHIKIQGRPLDQEFIDFLIARMSFALGPLGEVVVEDGLEALGGDRDNFPSFRAAELINFLSAEIAREDRRIEFKQAMLKKIKEKGY